MIIIQGVIFLKNIYKGKVAIIGAGFVGSTIGYALMTSGLASEIVLVDINSEKALGEAMDLSHGAPFVKPVEIHYGDWSACKKANIIIYAAGANQQPGETRLDLIHKNVRILKNTIPEIVKYCADSILLMVSNPVDILTYITIKLSGFSPSRVIGSGTVLDSSRFRYVLSKYLEVDPRNIHGYIIGEHGDTEVPVWSLTNVSGLSIDNYCKSIGKPSLSVNDKEKIYLEVKNAGYEIIKRKEATYYAIGLAVRRIVECIIRDEHSILAVSSLLEGQFSLNQVCLSLPSIVSEAGRLKVLEIPLAKNELELLNKSANALKDIISKVSI